MCHLHHPSALANQGRRVSTGSNALLYRAVLELSSIRNTVFAHNCSARISSEQFTKLMLKIEQIFYVFKFPALGLNRIKEGDLHDIYKERIKCEEQLDDVNDMKNQQTQCKEHCTLAQCLKEKRT